uniref:(northern house mosquito) hypothetical protein n=1 Tax=Culex pipiens TaxID=7175 RepID=A0A8D8JRU1_CULPI
MLRGGRSISNNKSVNLLLLQSRCCLNPMTPITTPQISFPNLVQLQSSFTNHTSTIQNNIQRSAVITANTHWMSRRRHRQFFPPTLSISNHIGSSFAHSLLLLFSPPIFSHQNCTQILLE